MGFPNDGVPWSGIAGICKDKIASSNSGDGRRRRSRRVRCVLGKLVECITVDYIVQGTFACLMHYSADYADVKTCKFLSPAIRSTQGLVPTSQNPKNDFPPH